MGFPQGHGKRTFHLSSLKDGIRVPSDQKLCIRGGFEIKIRMCPAGSCMLRIREKSG